MFPSSAFAVNESCIYKEFMFRKPLSRETFVKIELRERKVKVLKGKIQFQRENKVENKFRDKREH